MPNHMMVDLETLATGAGAALLQVGWAVFDPAGTAIVHAYQHNVNVDSCTIHGARVSHSAILWWLNQAPAARQSIMTNVALPISDVLGRLYDAYERYSCVAVWSHGATFDIPIIDWYAERLRIKPPWKYYDCRDTRTLYALAKSTGWQQDKKPVAHTAMADAVAQAADVQAAWAWIHGAGARAVEKYLDDSRTVIKKSVGRPPEMM
jgi:exodeoxyribonuclease VIII